MTSPKTQDFFPFQPPFTTIDSSNVNDHLGLGLPGDVVDSNHLSHRISLRYFAGRLGGNQSYVVNGNKEEGERILKETPDANPFFSWSDSFDLKGFLVVDLYKSAIIEAWGMSNPSFSPRK